MAGPPPELYDLPEGVEPTTELLADLDHCLEIGLGRLGGDSPDALESVADSFTGTPLSDRLDAAVEDISQSQFETQSFEAVAAARTSLQGARYDALLDHVCDVYGWTRPALEVDDPREPDEEVANLLDSTQQWLTEVAIAGFGSLEEDTVAPFESTLRRLKIHEETEQLATLLSGFVRELLRNTPTASTDSVPTARWADCWSRAMIRATKHPGSVGAETISGELRVLGSDLRHHDTAVSVVIYGLLDSEDVETDADERLVRATVSAGKVDAIAGNRLWRVFPDSMSDVLKSLAENRTIEFEGAELRSTGDLVLPRSASAGEECDKLDLFEEHFSDPAGVDLLVPDQQPLGRHPAQIAAPAYLDDFEVEDDGTGLPEMEFEGTEPLVLDTDRISPYSGIDVEHVTGSKRVGGLLRFDGGRWTVQPLVETKRSKRVYTALDAEPGKESKLVDGLRERADVLLREKS